MKHLGTQTLETERLILRKYTVDDAEAMYQNWASDDEVTKYLTWPPHASAEATRSLLKEWTEAYANPTMYHWAITIKAYGDEPIGDISVTELKEKAEVAEIGYCIGKRWWHQGITSEAMAAVMKFLFDTVNVNKIEARHDTNNPNSGRVMQKCGMKYEGTLRQSDWNNQGVCDACYYGLINKER